MEGGGKWWGVVQIFRLRAYAVELLFGMSVKRHYSKLVGAYMYRDGGSFEAKFVCDDGGFETVWLEAAPESPRQHVLVHSRLQIFRDLDRAVVPEEVAKNSPRETEIVTALRDFLANPSVDVPFGHRTPARTFLEYVERLVYYIPRRQPGADRADG
jgi:hypothetical protein